MARVTTDSGPGTLLPEAFYVFLRRRCGDAAGLTLIATSSALFLSLLTFVPGDPSLNSATGDAVANLFGRPGSYVADLLLQTLGLASGLLVAAALVWGWQVLRRRPPTRPWLRLFLLIVAVVCMATAFAALPVPDAWPLAVGFGGVIGGFVDAALATTVAVLQTPPPEWSIAAVAAALALAALIGALGVTWSEWRASGRGLVAGAATMGRGIKKGGEIAVDSVARLRERVEPRLIGAAPVDEDMAEDDDADEEDFPVLAPRSIDDASRVEPRVPRSKPSKRAKASRQGRLDLGPGEEYGLPSVELLDAAPVGAADPAIGQEALEQNARLLESVLEDFGVHGEIVKVRPGPVVTLYELEPAPGTKTSRVIGLADDIARSMSAVSVRVAVVPGRNVIGLELPNAKRETVHLRDILASEDFEKHGGKLTLALGKDIGGMPVNVDLARMPHMLIAGTTGSGKSVAINTMLLALLYQHSPERCKFIMIDPKMLELSVYEDIPHLLCPVVTEPGKAVVALKWAVREMEERYRAMSQLGVRNIAGYNARLAEAEKKGEVLTRHVQTGFNPESGKPVVEDLPLSMEPLPFIVVVVDEMADLMLVAGKDIEAAVQRLAQMARAAGIHLIMATQRPSVDVITGTIKANFPTRVSFQVTSKIDSRTILGEQGAEQLLGQGDMLYMAGGGRISRVHGPFVSDEEVERVVSYLKTQGEPAYLSEVTEEVDGGAGFGASGGDGDSGDVLYDEALAVIIREGKASTSFIQRHLQIGYNRAARIIERMEKEGVVSPANRVGKREVLIGTGSHGA